LITHVLAADAGQVVDTLLTQYGPGGVLGICAVAAVRVLYARDQKTMDAERARTDEQLKLEREGRARVEAELARLNSAVQEKYLTTLAQATVAISEALLLAREKRR